MQTPIRSTVCVLVASLGLALLAGPALAQKKDAEDDRRAVPERRLPSEVLAGVQIVENQFQRALEKDCAPERCFAKGCTYVAHQTVDRPSSTSLPGLGLTPAPGGAPEQVYLTTVECAFTHEKSVRDRDAKALAGRLESKLSKSWTKVEVSYERLKPVPEFLKDAPEPPTEPEGEPEVFDAEGTDAEEKEETPPEWNAQVAAREFWESVLPHFPWMIGLLMATLVALLLIWALRRLGKASPEEQALLASLAAGGGLAADDEEDDPGDDDPEGPPPPSDDEATQARISARLQAWRERLAASDVDADTALHVLVSDLLRTGERRMLAKAVIMFPDAFPKAFPRSGDFASAKFELAEYLKHADATALPTDEAFFDKLDRYAMSAALTAHPDTELIRSLHDDFGPAALVDAIGRLPARPAALLFAVAPEAMQHEAVRTLDERTLAALIDQLMRSNRMDPAETTYLLDVLGALKSAEALPAPPTQAVSDRGASFDAPAALSIMLPRVSPETRQALVQAALSRNAGHLPSWMGDTLYGEMLLRLDDETRTDLMLAAPIDAVAAWLRVQSEASATAIRGRLPNSLKAALGGVPTPATPAALYALANDGRAALSAGLQKRLARRDAPFHSLLV